MEIEKYKDTYWGYYTDYATKVIHIENISINTNMYNIVLRGIFNNIHNNGKEVPGITTNQIVITVASSQEFEEILKEYRYYQIDKETFDAIMSLYIDYREYFHNISRKIKKTIKNKSK